MKTVKSILREKGEAVWTISPDSTVYGALRMMAERNIGALVVIDKDSVIGIMSERDYARKVILHGKSSREMQVGEIMTSKVYYVRPDQSVQECMVQMTDRHIRHLPVMENERLVGVISIGDVVKTIIAEQEDTIKQLENYISGGISAV